MSLPRLIVAIVWLGLAGVGVTWRRRLEPGGRLRVALSVMSVLYTLLGLLWLDLAL